MATPVPTPPTYRFKSNAKAVLGAIGETLVVIEVTNEYFKLVGQGFHPDNSQPTFVGELLSGAYDGHRFWLEPGWYERLTEWASPSDTP